jgi:hypothetical protein
LRAAAAKAAADLARVTAELEKEKRKKAAPAVSSPAPTSTSGRQGGAKKSAAVIRREQVLSETLTFQMFETDKWFVLYLCRCRCRNQVAAAMTNCSM